MKKFFKLVGVILTICVLSVLSVFAADNPQIVETQNRNEEIVFYVKGLEGEVSSPEALIGNQKCDNVKVSYLKDESFYMKTLILIDNSISIPEKSREKIKESILDVIAGRTSKEQFAIGLFDEKANVIQDFTDDYATLKSVVEGIEYKDQETYLTDVLYEVLNQDVFADSEGAHYNRVLIVSDGVDNKTLGYTQEELSALLRTKRIPVYTLGVYNSKKTNEEQLKNMFAIARTSKAESMLLDDGGVAEMMAKDKDVAQVVVNPDVALKDGSIKTVTINLKAGSSEVSLKEDNVAMAQVAAIEKDQDKTTETEKKEEKEKKSEPAKPAMPEPEVKKNPSGGDNMILIAVLGIVGLGIVIAVIVMLLKKKSAKSNSDAEKKDPFAGIEKDKTDTTIMLEENLTAAKGRGGTLHILDDGKSYSLTLTDISAPSRSFQKTIKDKLIIGRKQEQCDICIDYDRTVSSQHCEIELRQEKMFLRDLQSSNGTYLNESRVTGEVEIYSGCIIKMGRVEMRVELS